MRSGRLAAYYQLNAGVARWTRPPAERNWRCGERPGDVVRVREVPRVDVDGPPAIARTEFGSGSQPTVRRAPLDQVIERRVEDGRLCRRVRGQCHARRAANVAGPFEPQTTGPLRRVVQPVTGDVAGDAPTPDRDVAIVSGVQPRQVPSRLQAAGNAAARLDLQAPNRRRRGVADVEH